MSVETPMVLAEPKVEAPTPFWAAAGAAPMTTAARTSRSPTRAARSPWKVRRQPGAPLSNCVSSVSVQEVEQLPERQREQGLG